MEKNVLFVYPFVPLSVSDYRRRSTFLLLLSSKDPSDLRGAPTNAWLSTVAAASHDPGPALEGGVISVLKIFI